MTHRTLPPFALAAPALTYSIPGFYEPVNSLLHLIAAVVFAVIGIRMTRRFRGDRTRTVLLGIFTFTSVFMLSMSGVYHMLAGGTAGANVMVRLDHASIFVLIAGTFTPIQGLLAHGRARWIGLAAMWIAALTGVVLKTVFFDSMPTGVGTLLYLALGWSASVPIIGLWRARGFRSIFNVVAGGVAYSAGAILLALEWPTLIPRVFGPHEFWHVAVILGLSLHWRFVVQLAYDHDTARIARAR